MRPKLFVLLAVPVLALAGCSAGESSPVPAEAPPASAVSAEPKPTSIDDINQDTDEATHNEVAFIEVSKMRAKSHGLPEPDAEKLRTALYKYCDSGKPIKLTKDADVDEAITYIASMGTCEKIGR